MISIKNQMQKKISPAIIFPVLTMMTFLITSVFWNYSILTSILPLIILLFVMTFIFFILTLLIIKKIKLEIKKEPIWQMQERKGKKKSLVLFLNKTVW